jgi:crotonobetainyl-CoA:carnitine CoA-transferase CaiB-like acyl-CoA transferase
MATDVNSQKFRTPALPIELDGQSLGADLIVPKLGQHTADVLAELAVPKGLGGE